MIGARDDENSVNSWYTGEELDSVLIDWVLNGNPINSGLPGKQRQQLLQLRKKKKIKL